MHLLDLPQELLLKIFRQVPQELRPTCRAFTVLHNDLYQTRFLETFGEDGINSITTPGVFHTLVDYVMSLDYWLGYQRSIIESYYNLKDPDYLQPSLDSKYIADSWQVIYGLFKNRRLHIDTGDYTVRGSKVSTTKNMRLTKGLYNMACGVILKGNTNGISLSATVNTEDGMLMSYMAPTNIHELVPVAKFVVIDMGDFEVTEDGDISLVLSESVHRTTSDYIVCYVDINAYAANDVYVDVDGSSKCKNQKYWLAWWVENQVASVDTVVNVLLKRFYECLDKSLRGAIVDVEDADVDVKTYSQKYYSKVNDDGTLVERTFKFKTQNDRKRYQSWAATSLVNTAEEAKWLHTEPLKWKMGSLMSV